METTSHSPRPHTVRSRSRNPAALPGFPEGSRVRYASAPARESLCGYPFHARSLAARAPPPPRFPQALRLPRTHVPVCAPPCLHPPQRHEVAAVRSFPLTSSCPTLYYSGGSWRIPQCCDYACSCLSRFFLSAAPPLARSLFRSKEVHGYSLTRRWRRVPPRSCSRIRKTKRSDLCIRLKF